MDQNGYTEKCHYALQKLHRFVYIASENEQYDRIRFIDDNIYLFHNSHIN